MFADVTSANIVGYQENTMNASANTMATATFLNVGDTKNFTLADLSVKGYVLPQFDEKGKLVKGTGTKGDFCLRLLDSTGDYEAQYYWVDYQKDVTAGWFLDKLGTSPISGGAASVTIKAGRGLWITGKGFKLVPSGAVNQKLVQFETNGGTVNTAIGNCMPVDMTLDQFFVDGYTLPQFDEKGKLVKGTGTKGDFCLRLLDSTGDYEAQYYWVDYQKGVTAGWFKDKLGTTPIEGGAASVTITAGRGLWCTGKGYNLNIPAPKID